MRTYEFKLYPTKEQEQKLYSVLWECKNVYNRALEEWKQHYDATGKYLNRFEQDKRYNKQTCPLVPAVLVDKILAKLHNVLGNFFKAKREGRKVGFPRFKSIHAWSSIQFRDKTNYLDKDNKFHAGKMCGGKIKTKVHRPTEGEFKNARIVKRASGWFVQLVCETQNKPLEKTNKQVGIDVGVRNIVADTNGEIIENPKYFKQSAQKLARHQAKLAKCTKGSKRRKKQRTLVAKCYEKITRQRKDFLHKLSNKYIKENDVIVIENLSVQKMIQNSNRSLSRNIQDSSWSMFKLMISYKAENAGRNLVLVNPAYTSQVCSGCGALVEKSLSTRTHMCLECGLVIDRDTNASYNILNEGYKTILAGTQPSVKREAPTL